MSKHRRPGSRRQHAAVVGLSAAVLATLATSSPALAAKGGGGGKPSSASSLRVLMVDPADTTVNWSDSITFEVTTSVEKPSVNLSCYRGGELVYAHSAGFFPEYPWPDAQTFTLQSKAWTGGAADCVADLHYVTSRGTFKTLATLSFPAAA